MKKKLYLFAGASILMMNSSALEYKSTKTMAFDSLRSINEGCLLVERQMKKEAIVKKCGTDFQASSLRIKSETEDSLSKLYLEMLSGYVIGFDKTHTTLDTSQDANKFECTISAKIEVKCQSGSRDAKHQPISAKLNKMIYIEGDNMVINIDSATHDRHISIVQIITRSNGKKEVWRVFPNGYDDNQFVPANKAIKFPSGYDLMTKLIDDTEMSEESLMIITTIDAPAPIKDKSSFEDFYSWLAEINLNNRREALLPYKIINTGKKT